MEFRIKEAREKAGYSQKDLAEIIGVAPNTFHGYESGKHDPKSDLLIKIAQACGTTVDFLLGHGEIQQQALDIKNMSEVEKEHIKKYRLLDPYGKEAVDGVLDVEFRRCEEDRQKQASVLKEQREQMEVGKIIDFETVIRFSVPGYSMPLSAGTGQEAGQEYPEDFKLIKKPPRGTSFIARVSGGSMEPTYQNGDLVFIHSCEEIRVGEIGAFFMDGQQWIKELGDGELISHNPGYDPIPMRDDIRCQGLVLGVCDESYFE